MGGVYARYDGEWYTVSGSGGSGPLGAQYADFSNDATGTFTDAEGDWKYVTFTSDGTLNCTRPGIFEILLVGGGAGGGKAAQGGGGAGGVIHGRVYVGDEDMTVIIGAGGNGGTSPGNGEDTAVGFSAGHGITAVGGGYGQSGGSQMGGSGGGGQGNPNGGTPGRGILYQGNDGGYPGQTASPNIASCGGGGAGSAGGAAKSVSSGGDGGEGIEVTGFGSNPTGSYVAGTYRVADGGGGGASATGGAAGGSSAGVGGSGNVGAGGAGVDGTGGGGGGGGSTWSGGQGPGGIGGSGIVVVKTMVKSALRKSLEAKRSKDK